jgi:hypothetical protein
MLNAECSMLNAQCLLLILSDRCRIHSIVNLPKK